MYIDLVMGLNFLVDYLLLMGTNALAGFPLTPGRTAAAAAVGGIYGGVCLLPGFSFLGNLFWRMVILTMMAVLAFGWKHSAIRRGILFIFLSMALGGIALTMGKGGSGGLVAAAAVVMLLCIAGFRGKAGGRRFTRVQVKLGERQQILTALYDTGNDLKDPVTGKPVLVVGADIAAALLGLTPRQLNEPLLTMTQVPGLRLIPYSSVGQPTGILLGMKMDEVRIDGKERDIIVAFAPQKLGNDGYQALAGGII